MRIFVLFQFFFSIYGFIFPFRKTHYNYYVKKQSFHENNIILNNDIDSTENAYQHANYNLNWYVIGEEKQMRKNKIEKITIWGKDYAVWTNGTAYLAVDNACTHRGASLSIGKVKDNNIVCPYHAYEFDGSGKLTHVPGLKNFKNTKCQNLNTYPVIARNGWIYMNTISQQVYNPGENIQIYNEPEANDASFKSIFINKDFNAYSRIVSENSLDVMHIGFVHSFGNAEEPSPTSEIPPHLVGDFPFHYKTIYNYTSGKESMAKKVFAVKDLVIENEFILPHTTIARVIFGNSTSTVITFAQPINITHSQLFVKTYRNFWYNAYDNALSNFINNIGDDFTTDMMRKTIMQDKALVESIPLNKVDGCFNMKYDKIQNVYTSLYKKLVHNISNFIR